MAAAAILKNRKLTYLLRGLSDFDIWHIDRRTTVFQHNFLHNTIIVGCTQGWLNFEISKIQDGGGRHLEKSKDSPLVVATSGQVLVRTVLLMLCELLEVLFLRSA